MIVDASALLAIALLEPEAERFTRAIASAARPRVPSVTWFEATLRVDTLGDAVAVSRFDDLIRTLGIKIVPVTADHAREARRARRLFGKPHQAQLNFGDCVAYGVARHENQPLLFKGGDFSLTDIKPALKD